MKKVLLFLIVLFLVGCSTPLQSSSDLVSTNFNSYALEAHLFLTIQNAENVSYFTFDYLEFVDIKRNSQKSFSNLSLNLSSTSEYDVQSSFTSIRIENQLFHSGVSGMQTLDYDAEPVYHVLELLITIFGNSTILEIYESDSYIKYTVDSSLEYFSEYFRVLPYLYDLQELTEKNIVFKINKETKFIEEFTLSGSGPDSIDNLYSFNHSVSLYDFNKNFSIEFP
ncbi:MAG: hypothetical protein ACMXYK_03530 [Candidatus Woesearchaeota archaeon]